MEGPTLSRTVIRDIVIPLVSKILIKDGFIDQYRTFHFRDRHLEEFLEEEMRRRFGVIGSNGSQHLRRQLEEAEKNDPYALEFLIRELLEKYVRLAITIRKHEIVAGGPPDRFSELRRWYYSHHVRQHRKGS